MSYRLIFLLPLIFLELLIVPLTASALMPGGVDCVVYNSSYSLLQSCIARNASIGLSEYGAEVVNKSVYAAYTNSQIWANSTELNGYTPAAPVSQPVIEMGSPPEHPNSAYPDDTTYVGAVPAPAPKGADAAGNFVPPKYLWDGWRGNPSAGSEGFVLDPNSHLLARPVPVKAVPAAQGVNPALSPWLNPVTDLPRIKNSCAYDELNRSLEECMISSVITLQGGQYTSADAKRIQEYLDSVDSRYDSASATDNETQGITLAPAPDPTTAGSSAADAPTPKFFDEGSYGPLYAPAPTIDQSDEGSYGPLYAPTPTAAPAPVPANGVYESGGIYDSGYRLGQRTAPGTTDSPPTFKTGWGWFDRVVLQIPDSTPNSPVQTSQPSIWDRIFGGSNSGTQQAPAPVQEGPTVSQYQPYNPNTGSVGAEDFGAYNPNDYAYPDTSKTLSTATSIDIVPSQSIFDSTGIVFPTGQTWSENFYNYQTDQREPMYDPYID